jgi:hypothetical protein
VSDRVGDLEGARLDINKPTVRITAALLTAQMTWAGLSALWNLAGVALIAAGQRAPGPTASILAAALLVAIAIALWVLSGRSRWLYAALSILAGLMALFAFINAFTATPDLWPSDFWRYAGAALNAGGVIAAMLALLNIRVPSQ